MQNIFIIVLFNEKRLLSALQQIILFLFPLPLVMHRLPLFTTRGYIESLLESQHILLERKRDLLQK